MNGQAKYRLFWEKEAGLIGLGALRFAMNKKHKEAGMRPAFLGMAPRLSATDEASERDNRIPKTPLRLLESFRG
jgi:hypothetical protein